MTEAAKGKKPISPEQTETRVNMPGLTPQERTTLRSQITQAIAHPVHAIDFLLALDIGANNPLPFPDDMGNITIINSIHGDDEAVYKGFVLKRCTVERSTELVQMVKNELSDSGREMDWRLDEWVHDIPDEDGEQSHVDHELAHIQKAQDMGIDLSTCDMRGMFAIQSGELSINLQFNMPEETDPYIRAHVALAPEEPSGGDISMFAKDFPAITASEKRAELAQVYLEKVGVPFDSLS